MRIGWKAATSDHNIASYRFRALRPIEALKERGHDVEVASLDRIDSYDAVVFSKSYRRADHQLARSLKATGKRVIFDLCDNHFYNPYNLTSYRSAHAELVEMVSLADLIVCSTPSLARVLVAESGTTKPVSVIGDAADLLDLPQRGVASATKTLLWFGSHGSPNAPCGMNDLLAIEPLLRKLSREHDFRLVVCSNNRSKFDSLKGYFATALDYAEWSLESFPALLADSEAVVIPLSRNPFVNCKTHNRVSTALGAGIPVIADAIESYREFAPFCTLDDWEKGLRDVLGNPDSARSRAKPARDYLLKHWSMEQIATQWEAALSLPTMSTVLANESATASVNGEPVVAPQPDRIIRRYQGAMDPHLLGSVTGWVVQPLDSARPLEVVLKIAGKTVAKDVAQRRRSDLEASGFRSNNCGFSLKVPAEYCDDEERPFELVADGSWVLESGHRRFGNSLVVEKLPDEAIPEPAVERPRGDKLKSALALATATLTDNAGELASVALQKRLFNDLEQLNAAVDAVRRIAARMILSAADQTDPLPQQLKIHPRERLSEQDPASPRSLS